MEKDTIIKIACLTIAVILARFLAQDIYMCKKYNGINKYFDQDLFHTISLIVLVIIISSISCFIRG